MPEFTSDYLINKRETPVSNLVEIKQVYFNRAERPIYENMSLAIPQGKITGILGPSGCGKTTLLRLIGGQLKAHRGEVLFAGQNMANLSRRRLYQTRQRMSMLFQSGALFSELSVFENVAFPLREHTTLAEELIQTIVKMKLEAVGLRGAGQLTPSELSGGMARRVALARSIALDPELIMYDEPFAGQDPISMGVLVKLIAELNTSLGLTSLIVSHDVQEVMSIADHLVVMANKQVIGQGSPKELQEQGSELVQQFLSGAPDGPVPFHYPASAYYDDLLGIRA